MRLRCVLPLPKADMRTDRNIVIPTPKERRGINNTSFATSSIPDLSDNPSQLIMGASWFTMRSLISLLFLFIHISSALKFDIYATSGHNERCIRNFVGQDQLVMVTAIVSGQRGDGQMVNMHVCFLFPSPHLPTTLRLGMLTLSNNRSKTPSETNTAIRRT